MGKVICVLNQKGGTAKTTTTVNLVDGLQRKGLKVLLVDGDPQGSSRIWHTASDGTVANVIGLDTKTIHSDIKIHKDNYDVIVVDGAPRSDILGGAQVRAADLVILPVSPSPLDLWGTTDMADMVKARQELTGGIPKAMFLVVDANKNTILSREIADALATYELPMLEARTHHRQMYRRSILDGETVYHSKDKSALEEVTAITNEIWEVLQDV